MWRIPVDQWPCIRRLSDGAIDYEYYRRKASAQRSAAIGDFFMPKKRIGLATTLTILARLRAVWKS
jgi:hypothetical protein